MNLADLHSESELVISLRNSSQDAFKQLFDRYSQKLYHFALSYLKSDSDSEEIVQEVFLKIWENRDHLQSDKSFKSYLFTIAFNAIKKRFNKKLKEDRYKHDFFDWLSEENPEIEEKIEYELLLNKLDSLINEFPEKRKKIFLLRKKEGKSILEIAELMEISPKTVKNQITAGMNSLKRSFQDEDISAFLFYFLFIS